MSWCRIETIWTGSEVPADLFWGVGQLYRGLIEFRRHSQPQVIFVAPDVFPEYRPEQIAGVPVQVCEACPAGIAIICDDVAAHASLHKPRTAADHQS